MPDHKIEKMTRIGFIAYCAKDFIAIAIRNDINRAYFLTFKSIYLFAINCIAVRVV